MENASKALIIAGSILLAILIIGVGMLVFNGVKDTITGGASSLDKTQIEAINSQFEAYIGTNIKGTNARQLCSLVRDNNLTADETTTFKITINTFTEAADINTLKASLSTGKYYTVVGTYNANTKLIDTITITEVK